MKPRNVQRFASPAALAAWYEAQHAGAAELWLAVAKKNAAQDVVPYRDALDLALAYGWIDGFVGKLDDTHYALRFTPRKPKSNWSAVNVKRYGELLAAGRITPAGAAAFESRDRAVSEERPAELSAPYLAQFRRQRRAWTFFEAQPPGYRRQAAWYVLSARTEDTRQRRLAALIEASANALRLAAVTGGTTTKVVPTANDPVKRPPGARRKTAAKRTVAPAGTAPPLKKTAAPHRRRQVST